MRCGASSMIARGRRAQVGEPAAHHAVEDVGGGGAESGSSRVGASGRIVTACASTGARERPARRSRSSSSTTRSGASICGQWPQPSISSTSPGSGVEQPLRAAVEDEPVAVAPHEQHLAADRVEVERAPQLGQHPAPGASMRATRGAVAVVARERATTLAGSPRAGRRTRAGGRPRRPRRDDGLGQRHGRRPSTSRTSGSCSMSANQRGMSRPAGATGRRRRAAVPALRRAQRDAARRASCRRRRPALAALARRRATAAAANASSCGAPAVASRSAVPKPGRSTAIARRPLAAEPVEHRRQVSAQSAQPCRARRAARRPRAPGRASRAREAPCGARTAAASIPFVSYPQ